VVIEITLQLGAIGGKRTVHRRRGYKLSS
jgi:hypothetical protein